MVSTVRPLTITHDVLRLHEALAGQLDLNEELRAQLFQAAKIINQLTDRCVSLQQQLNEITNASKNHC